MFTFANLNEYVLISLFKYLAENDKFVLERVNKQWQALLRESITQLAIAGPPSQDYLSGCWRRENQMNSEVILGKLAKVPKLPNLKRISDVWYDKNRFDEEEFGKQLATENSKLIAISGDLKFFMVYCSNLELPKIEELFLEMRDCYYLEQLANTIKNCKQLRKLTINDYIVHPETYDSQRKPERYADAVEIHRNFQNFMKVCGPQLTNYSTSPFLRISGDYLNPVLLEINYYKKHDSKFLGRFKNLKVLKILNLPSTRLQELIAIGLIGNGLKTIRIKFNSSMFQEDVDNLSKFLAINGTQLTKLKLFLFLDEGICLDSLITVLTYNCKNLISLNVWVHHEANVIFGHRNELDFLESKSQLRKLTIYWKIFTSQRQLAAVLDCCPKLRQLSFRYDSQYFKKRQIRTLMTNYATKNPKRKIKLIFFEIHDSILAEVSVVNNLTLDLRKL